MLTVNDFQWIQISPQTRRRAHVGAQVAFDDLLNYACLIDTVTAS
jgi:hypothetical protein